MIRFIGLHLCSAPLFFSYLAFRLFQLYITRWSHRLQTSLSVFHIDFVYPLCCII